LGRLLCEKKLLVHSFRTNSVHKEASSSKQTFSKFQAQNDKNLTSRTEKVVRSKKVFPLRIGVRQKKETLRNRAATKSKAHKSLKTIIAQFAQSTNHCVNLQAFTLSINFLDVPTIKSPFEILKIQPAK